MRLLLPGRLMRDFGTIVGVDSIDVLDCWHHGPMRGVIAFEFIRHQPARLIALAFKQATKEAHGRLLVPPTLDQDINRVAVLINGPPQILLFPLNRDEHFVEIPGISQATLSFLQFSSIRGSKLLTPLANGFIGDGEATLGEEFFNFTKAEAEPMIQPDGVADNVGGKTMTVVAGCLGFHAAQSAKRELN
jgi:hypothetical protein